MKHYEKKIMNEFYDTNGIEEVDFIDDEFMDDEFIDDDDFNEPLSEWEEGYSHGYSEGYSDAVNHMGPEDEIFEAIEGLKEATDIKSIINEVISTNWSGSNEEQMKAVTLLKGIATSDDPESNKFMKALDKATSEMKKV